MIEFTGCDPNSYRIETWRELVLLDNLLHVKEATSSNRLAHAELHFNGGKTIYVVESVDECSRRIRKFAEDDQRERMRTWIAEEVAKIVPEMADKAWRYEENSK